MMRVRQRTMDLGIAEQPMTTDTFGRGGSSPVQARWRWIARGAWISALTAVVLPLVLAGLRSLVLLAVGIAGVLISAAAAWWVVSRRGWRRAVGVIGAVSGLLGVVVVYAVER